MIRSASAFLLLVALAAPVGGHDFWLQPDTFFPAGGKTVDVQLHVGDGFVSEGDRPFEKKSMGRFVLVTAKGKTDLAAGAVDGKRPLARVSCQATGTHLVALEREPRLIQLEAKKFNAYLREEGLDDILAERRRRGETDRLGRERYGRSIKLLFRAGGSGDATWKTVLGQPLEIVPLDDPTGLRPGQTLRVRLLFDGKPLVGVKVFALSRDGAKVVRRVATTSARGEAAFAIERAGPHLVRLVHMRRAVGDKDADWQSFWAALTFAVR